MIDKHPTDPARQLPKPFDALRFPGPRTTFPGWGPRI
jgi:hypothetical protein